MAQAGKGGKGTMNKARTGANAVVYALAIIVGIVFANVVLTRVFARIDFTKEKVYTLSPASKELVKKLPDRLTVKAYISKDLQPPFSQVGQYVRDILDEYKNASSGRFVWEAVDPSGDAKLEEEATKNKVPKMRRGKISQDKVEIGSNYLGVSFQYQGNIESIPEINSQEGLEFQMSSIIKMMTVKKRKLAFANSEGELSVSGSGDQQNPSGLQAMKQYMNDYEVVPVALNGPGKVIPDDVDGLVIAGPRSPMSERAKFTIDQFLMRGKAVAIFADGMIIDQPRGMQMPGAAEQPRIGRKNDTGLSDLLEHYGLKLNDDIVLEPRQNVPGPVSMGGQIFLANYPTFIAATKLAEKHPATQATKAIVFPFASTLELVQSKEKQPGLVWTPIASTTEESWRQKGFFLYDPQSQELKIGDDKGPFVIAYAAEGPMKSFFEGKPVPQADGSKADPNQSAPTPDDPTLNESKAPARLLVVADSEFASDEYIRFARNLQVYASNLLFFLGSMDWLTQDETLAAARAKTVTSRPLTVSSELTPALVKYGNSLGVPLLFIGYGILRWRLRSAQRRNSRV